MNMSSKPIWEISPSHIVPPYLHILLGVVKKHHDLLEVDLHNIGHNIALDLSKQPQADLSGLDPMFAKWVRKKYKFTDFNKLHGPVTKHVNSVLEQRGITKQAYHSHSFVGNHCNLYLTESTIEDIKEAILHNTYQLTDDLYIQQIAEDVGQTFRTLNHLYARVHHLVGHKKRIGTDELQNIQTAIDQYLQFCRAKFAQESRITPKQHLLEYHVVDWVREWG
jgi:hypothetical protein